MTWSFAAARWSRPMARQQAESAIEDGRIAAIGAGAAPAGRDEIDARGLHVFPGVVDVARALQRAGPHRLGRRGDRQPRAGGRRRHDVLRHAAQLVAVHGQRRASSNASAPRSTASSITDFALWGGLVPGNRRRHGGHGRRRRRRASRRSCATPGCRSSRAPTTSRCSRA